MNIETAVKTLEELAQHHRTYDEDTEAIGVVLKELTASRADAERLAGALIDARASFLGLQPDFGGPVAAQMGIAVERISAALAAHEKDSK
jgi:hypothetical protein